MFGLFKTKKTPKTALDVLIQHIYGDNPPVKSAQIDESIRLAYEELLISIVDRQDVVDIANQLNKGSIPYSTHDLAVSVALNFFMRPELNGKLDTAQFIARITVLEWLDEKKLAPRLVQTFENTLYKLYKP